MAAMKAIAAIAQNPNSRLLEDFGSVWTAYLTRARDPVTRIRLAFAKQTLNILVNATQLRGTLCGQFF